MKAVIYARYSSDNQREESIEGQLRECTAFAEKNGITILRHYIDRAYSAKTDMDLQHLKVAIRALAFYVKKRVQMKHLWQRVFRDSLLFLFRIGIL